MSTLERGTFYQVSEVTTDGSSVPVRIMREDPRRVGIVLGYSTGNLVWPKISPTLTLIGYNLGAMPATRITLHDDGPIVGAEWWFTNVAVSGVVFVETLLERGSIYTQADAPLPGRKCWRYRDGRWEPYAGAIPGPGADPIDGGVTEGDREHQRGLIRGGEFGPDVSLIFPRANEPDHPVT